MSLKRHLNFLYYKRNLSFKSSRNHFVYEVLFVSTRDSEEDKVDSEPDSDISETYDADMSFRFRDLQEPHFNVWLFGVWPYLLLINLILLLQTRIDFLAFEQNFSFSSWALVYVHCKFEHTLVSLICYFNILLSSNFRGIEKVHFVST
jgi:hypothetical protein